MRPKKACVAAAALGATMLLGGCETTDWDTIGAALSLYNDISYLNGDCPYGLHKYYDRDGHHYCSLDDHPGFNPRDRDDRHRDGDDDSSAAD